MNKTTRILVVDDEPEILNFFTLILNDAGYDVLKASTGQDGLQLAREKRPDLVLLDVLLPDLNGMEVCKQIKSDPDLHDVFVVLISGGVTDAVHKVEGLVSGADDYLVKPLDPEELLARIRSIVRLRDIMAALRASEEHHRRLIDILPDAVCLIHPEGRLLAVNSQAVAMLGYANPEELLHRSAFDIVPVEEHDRIKADIATTLQVGIIRNAGYTLLKKNGAPLQVELSATVSLDGNGQPAGMLIVGRDVTKRKQTEESLRQSQERYRSIFENATEGIFRTTPEGRILIANPALARMFGYQSPQEMMSSVTDVGRQIYVSPERRVEMKRLLLEQGSVQEFEEENYRKDGSIIGVRLNAHVVRDAGGAILYIEGTIQDITERKRITRLLQTQRDFGTFLSSSISLHATAVKLLEIALQNEGIDCGGVFLVDPVTGALDLVAHRGFSSEFAKRASHFAADPAPALSAGIGRASFRQPGQPLAGIVQQLKRESLLAMEVLPVQHSGEVVAVLSVGSHVCGEIPAKTNQAMEAISTQAAGAITRIKAERLLRANRRLLEKTLHSLRSAVLIVNADTMVIEECNAATTQIFGYTRGELIGRTTACLHANEAMAKQFASHLHSAVEDKGFLSDFEFKMRHKEGTVFPTEQSMMPIRNEVGGLVSWVSVIHDITERKRVEEELRQLPWRIIEAQETERLRMARDMHDGVNQVIASVKMRLHKVESSAGTLNPSAREILARCDKLLVQALEENRRIAYNLRPSDLDELGLASACRNFCNEIQARTNLTVKCNIAPLGQRLPAAVELNLFRIVQEALTNVEKHAHAKTVRLRLSCQGNSILLKIQDDGLGFAPKRSKARAGRWRGIGLTNMRERALSLGGACEVLSTPKKGTTINVRIPCQHAG